MENRRALANGSPYACGCLSSRASLTAIHATASTPPTSTAHSSVTRHGNSYGTCSAAAPPSSRRAPSAARGGGAPPPATRATRPPTSHRGRPPARACRPRAGTAPCPRPPRAAAPAGTRAELDALAAQRLRRRDAPVARVAPADGDRARSRTAGPERQLVEQLARTRPASHGPSSELARRDAAARPAVVVREIERHGADGQRAARIEVERVRRRVIVDWRAGCRERFDRRDLGRGALRPSSSRALRAPGANPAACSPGVTRK